MDKTSSPFVILFHKVSPSFMRQTDHWDIMFQIGETLKTWALETEPSVPMKDVALQLPDHRLAYLDFEGELSANRGHVSKWDEGHYSVLASSDELLQVEMRGRIIQATLTLAKSDGANWELNAE